MKKIMFLIFFCIMFLIVTGCSDKTFNHKNVNTDNNSEKSNVSANSSKTASSDSLMECQILQAIKNASEDKDSITHYLKQLRVERENKHNEDIEFHISLIKSLNKDKSEAEIQKEIDEYKSTSESLYKYEVDFINDSEEKVSKYISDEISSEQLQKDICDLCKYYGYIRECHGN